MNGELTQPTAWRQRLAAMPVVKSGLSLMTGTVVTSGLGLVFWILAANLYDAEDFGVATTAVYTMMMLADVACVGLRTGLVRFLPSAGRRVPRTILWAYGIVLVASVVTGTGFLAGLDLWAGELNELRTAVLLATFFVGSTAFWALFMLEDAVLVGLRKATWVPMENTLFGLLKIALLFPFAAISPTLGIFWAWTIPVFPIVIGINLLIARVIRPGRTPSRDPDAHETSSDAPGDGMNRSLLRAMLSFSLTDWVGALARLVALGVIPLMVLAQEGKAAAGYFQAAWLIAFTIFALSSNAAYALLAEASYEKSSLDKQSLHAGALTLALTVPIILIGVIGAPLLLLIYGSDYSANSTTVLRVLLVAAIPNAIHQLYIGRLRSKSRIGQVVFFETLLSVLVVGLTAVLLPRYGIDGVGVAWLIGLSVLAFYALIVESEWWWASRLDTRLVRSLGAAKRTAARWLGRRSANRIDPDIQAVVDAIGESSAIARRAGDHGCVAAVVTDRTGPDLVVELARTAEAGSALDRRRRVVEELAASPYGAHVSPVLPEIHAAGEIDGRPYTVWVGLAGRRATDVVGHDSAASSIEIVAPSILEALGPLHRATTRTITVGDDELERWVGTPIEHLAAAGRASPDNLDLLRRTLRHALTATEVDTARIHGRLTLRNVFLQDVAVGDEPPAVTGLVAWGASEELPVALDATTLALTSLASASRRELGELVVELLADPTPFAEHPAMRADGSTPLPTITLLLLTWLRLVGRPLQLGEVSSSEAFWHARNTRPVLAALANGVPAGIGAG